MKKLLNRLMVSCRKATELIDKDGGSGLSYWEEFQLSFHTLVCGACRAYKKQSKWIDQALKGHFRIQDSEQVSLEENPGLNEKIHKFLKDIP